MDVSRLNLYDGALGGADRDRSNDLVIDSWRHRQVANTNGHSDGLPLGLGANSVRGLGNDDGLYHSMRSLENEMELNRSVRSIGDGATVGINGNASRDVQLRGLQGSGSAFVNLSDLHLSQGSGLAGLTLEMNPNSALSPKQSIAEFSMRRSEAVRSAFRRVDQRDLGNITMQELEAALQRYSNLSLSDQKRVALGICGSNPHRVSFTQFTAYYQMLGRTIERDRDFEDVMRHHFGFPEVCDVLDDMKNKFMMVGLAYTFRHRLDKGGGCPELSVEAFQEAIGQVGMSYRQQDIKRVFDAFDPSGGSANPTLEVLKLTGHLASAPKPPTPLPALYGTAHFSEVNSQADISPNSTGFMHGMSVNSASYAAIGGYGSSGGSHPHPAHAPPESFEVMPEEQPPPQAPPEEEDDGVLAPPEDGAGHTSEMPYAPPEDHDNGVQAPSETGHANPNEPPPLAPPEDHDYAPHEAGFAGDDDDVHAPQEKAHATQSSLSHSGKHMGGKYSTTGHLAAAAAAGNSIPAGRQRAVTVGINYIGTPNQLAGCINDSDSFIKCLTEEFGYKVADIRQLRDDHPQRMPTRKNMTAALNWLLNGAKAGDHLFFHYSGHGSQQRDTNGDEMDGKDDTLVPCDFQRNGMLSDDDLRRLLVVPLPAGARLTIVLDCCHSGTACDLPYKVRIGADGRATMKKKKAYQMPTQRSEGDVVMVSGCMDTQTSADIGAGSAGNTKAAGAMTTAFMTTIKNHPTISYYDIIEEMRKFMQMKGFQQVPQLSSEQFLSLSDCFMPEVQPPYEHPAPPLRTPARKALTIGINYLTLPQGRGRLAGCANDSDTMVGILRDTFGFMDNQITRLREDTPNMMPTRANILKYMQWLTQGAQNGDEMFLHYSGHGGQKEDRNGDEKDGKDDTLIPCDFETAGQIIDDDLHEILVASLPKGCRLWVILDCCHSGTALDLQFKVRSDNDGTVSCTRSSTRRNSKPCEAEVVMISGCKDTQTSADISAGSLGVTKAAGAMTTAFRHTITPTITCEDLLLCMRQFLKTNAFDQVPQMSSDQFVQLDTSFVNYQAKARGKRSLPPMMGTRAVTPMSPQMGHMGHMGHSASAPSLAGTPLSAGGHGEARMDSRISRLEDEITRLRNQQMASPLMGMLPPGPMLLPASPQLGMAAQFAQPLSPHLSPQPQRVPGWGMNSGWS